MTTDQVFTICNNIAMIGWLLLIIISPFWIHTDKLLIGIIITLFAVVYAWLIFKGFNPGDFQKFNSLNGVMDLFTNKTAVAAGWVHYLAFDLMTGVWIKKNSQRYNIKHLIIVPCLFFTFMLGPIGLLLYFIVRLIKTKKYFVENF